MTVTGTLRFVDIGTGAWYLDYEHGRIRLYVKPDDLDTMIADTEVTMEVESLSDQTLDYAMLHETPVLFKTFVSPE